MNIVRWDSLHDMGPTQEWMIRVLEGKSAHEQAELAQGSWVPAVDIYSRGDRELVLKAAYNAGILTVRLPLREETKPTHIKVEVAA